MILIKMANEKENLEKALIMLSRIKYDLEECCQSELDADSLRNYIDKFFKEVGIEDTYQNEYFRRKE